MRRAIVQIVTGVALVAGVVTACGSGDSSGSGAASSSSSASQNGAGDQNGQNGQNGQSGANGSASQAPGQEGGANGAAAQQVTAAIQQVAGQLKFQPEQATLTPEAKQGLEQIAKALQGNDVKLNVVTHAGYPDAEKAKTLSQQRAEAIASALEASGVAKDRVHTEASGNEKAQGDQALDTQISVAQ